MQSFRIFISTRMVFWVVIGLIVIPVLAIEALLLLLLLLPQVPRRPSRYFVPLTPLSGVLRRRSWSRRAMLPLSIWDCGA